MDEQTEMRATALLAMLTQNEIYALVMIALGKPVEPQEAGKLIEYRLVEHDAGALFPSQVGWICADLLANLIEEHNVIEKADAVDCHKP